MGQTLFDKLWMQHVVHDDEEALIYIDRHFVHEVTSPQAFDGLRLHQRPVWRTESIVATADHSTPTTDWHQGIPDPISRAQVDALDHNIDEFAVKKYFPFRSPGQGIVHVIGPEIGASLPGMTIVCGDSHTSTHGAFAALAFGIGTSEVEHVLATQCLRLRRLKNLRAHFSGVLPFGVSAKDMALAFIAKIGHGGGTGYAVEFCGPAVRNLPMSGRMTLCNLAIEAGARSGMVAYDDVTERYLADLPLVPKGALWTQATAAWRQLVSDPDAQFDYAVDMDVSNLAPQVTWGTSPDMSIAIDQTTPKLSDAANDSQQENWKNAYDYMNLEPGMRAQDIKLDKIFIGSCTNARLDDLQTAARVIANQQIASNIKQALVVPGSVAIKKQAEALGLDRVFKNAGFEWRQPGCSMCLGMNADVLSPYERCAATSNRNFEGRQGALSRTHLVSPAMAALAAIRGHFADVRTLSASE